MALISPGVQVTIIDESNYLPANVGSVPFILIATAQDKLSGSGVGIAAGTTKANANKLYLITSQRDLAATFGNPFFYKTTNGTPINGYELNEYGLLAAYSVLGISNRAYVQRADIDLSQLTASLTRPLGEPTNGTFWFDTTETAWGIFEWSYTTSAFTLKTPIVITDETDLSAGVPLASIGNIGDYAVVATNSNNPVYFKTPGNPVSEPGVSANSWVLVGSEDWQNSWPTIIGSNSNPTLTIGNKFSINGTEVVVDDTTVQSVADAINTWAITGLPGVCASVSSGKLQIFGNNLATPDGSTLGTIVITAGTGTVLTDLGITAGTYYVPTLQQSPSYTVPNWRVTSTSPRPSGSVWNKTNNVNQGADFIIKKYSTTLGSWVAQSCPIYQNDQSANKALDPAVGGRNIPIGYTYAQYDVNEDNTFTLTIYERVAQGPTVVQGNITDSVFVLGDTFTISSSNKTDTTMTTPVTATLAGTNAAAFVTAFLAANVPYTTASVNADGSITIQHTQGGVIELANGIGNPLDDAGISVADTGVKTGPNGELVLSNWVALDYTASDSAPDVTPDDGRMWYYSAVDQVDIMINNGNDWVGYRNETSDIRGFNLTQTDPNGPQVDSAPPTTQSDGTPLVYGDLWIDSTDLEAYPMLYRWESVLGEDQWVLINNSDSTTENGILFADARWATNGNTDPIYDPIPSIVDLLESNYLDLDAPDSELYPNGCLLWNTRRSGFNVKSFQINYFNSTSFPDTTLPAVKNAWVTVSGNQSTGAMYAGRNAVRSMIVQALKASIDGNQDLREEQRDYNLIACPQYPELQLNMVALNNERNNTAFIIADTPMRLPDNGTAIMAYSESTAVGAADAPLNDIYMGMFYPSCQTNDLTGATVVQPPSHMMLRTIIRSDEVSFPWLAPAGTRRGLVDNAFALGYVDADSGNFVSTAIRRGIRDTLYENKINPITFLPGTGILNYGQKTRSPYASALDRINVARLVNFIRGRLQTIGSNFLFEPNDQTTRDEVKNTVEGLLNDLIAKRGIYDYLVVCDESNNTPERIDRNELYVDIAIEPVKAVEFIYIPVRIKNTGEISAGNTASSSTV